MLSQLLLPCSILMGYLPDKGAQDQNPDTDIPNDPSQSTGTALAIAAVWSEKNKRKKERKAGGELSTAELRCGIGRKSRSRAPLYSEDKQGKKDSHFCLTNSSRFSTAIRALPPRGLPHTV